MSNAPEAIPASDVRKRALPVSPTRALYHYRTQEDLSGIITKRKSWATHKLEAGDEIHLGRVVLVFENG